MIEVKPASSKNLRPFLPPLYKPYDKVKVISGTEEGTIGTIRNFMYISEVYDYIYEVRIDDSCSKTCHEAELELFEKYDDSPIYDSYTQEAKADKGKPKISLVPRQIIWDIAEVREYGNKKYGSPDNWRNVEVERYRDALLRHTLKYLDDPESVDEESGIKHSKHMACNMAFICELENKDESIRNGRIYERYY